MNKEGKQIVFHAGMNAEVKVESLLRGRGFKVSRAPKIHASHDLLLEDFYRVDVKHSLGNTRLLYKNDITIDRQCWLFNIHHQGILNESRIDGYIFRLEGIPGFKAALHLFAAAPLGRPTLKITMRSLLQRYSLWANAFQCLRPETLRIQGAGRVGHL